jgi:hypothetical protein
MSCPASFVLTACLTLAFAASAQTVRNPKLSAEDLAAARAATASEEGEGAELTYAARIDAIEKGSFDTLVVIYAKPPAADTRSGGEKLYFGLVVRGEQKFPLKLDKAGRALKSGDRFLRLGLRHAEGKPPVLRLIAAASEAGGGEMQRNVDYQFDGRNFALLAQTLSPLAK